jgi:hypothetical protein
MKLKELLNESTTSTLVDAIISKSTKFDKIVKYSNIDGIKNFRITKNEMNMTLWLGDNDDEYPMLDVVRTNMVNNELIVKLPERINKIGFKKIDSILSKLIKEFDKNVSESSQYKKFICEATDVAIKIGRGETVKILKPGGKASIYFGKKYAIIPKISNKEEVNENKHLLSEGLLDVLRGYLGDNLDGLIIRNEEEAYIETQKYSDRSIEIIINALEELGYTPEIQDDRSIKLDYKKNKNIDW